MDDLMERYVALWNEPDAAAREAAVRSLWTPEGAQLLQAPLELRERAAALGFPAPVLTVRGHAELVTRVSRAYEEFVLGGGYRFRSRGTPARVADAFKLGWEMVDGAGNVAGGGTDILLLDLAGRIVTDYQFVD